MTDYINPGETDTFIIEPIFLWFLFVTELMVFYRMACIGSAL